MNGELVQEWTSIACFVMGAFFVLTGAVGMLRMPDFFSRTHAASLMDSIGLPLVLLGLLLQIPFGLLSLKILLLAGFAMITSATAAHALAQAAVADGVKPVLKKAKRS